MEEVVPFAGHLVTQQLPQDRKEGVEGRVLKRISQWIEEEAFSLTTAAVVAVVHCSGSLVPVVLVVSYCQGRKVLSLSLSLSHSLHSAILLLLLLRRRRRAVDTVLLGLTCKYLCLGTHGGGEGGKD